MDQKMVPSSEVVNECPRCHADLPEDAHRCPRCGLCVSCSSQ
ncbi:MAG: zinc-ribbon domain-containing protein [Candidatus Caldarchaeales archaeon]